MELFEASNRLSRAIYNIFMSKTHEFNELGDWIVAIYMKPSYRAIITILAIWKSGAAYLPLNFELPQKRIKEILKEAKPQLVVTDDEQSSNADVRNDFGDFQVVDFKEFLKLSRKLSSNDVTEDHSLNLVKNNLAVIYYSSEILTPLKGTRIHHNRCQLRLEWQWTKFPFEDNETHCISHNTIFHIDHFAEVWAPLLLGKSVVIVKEENRYNPSKLIEIMEKFKICRFYGLPSKINKILDVVETTPSSSSEKRLKNVKLWISSGDELTMDIVEKFFKFYENDGEHTIANFYGCTETTGDCCCYVIKSLEQIQSLRRVPIGQPTFNTYIYLLDESKDTVEKGEKGEIFVSGGFLAECYVGNFNNDAYDRNPFNLIPMYWKMFRTGDYGTIINEQLYYDGRNKFKVRYNNHEINYNVVENYINDLSYVEKSVVIPMAENLVAFVLLKRKSSNMLVETIKADLEKEIPAFLMPEIIIVYRLLTLENGEIDKEALISKYKEMNGTEYTAKINVIIDLDGLSKDRHDLARKVFTILGKNIGCDLMENIKPTSNFFQIGGSSLNALATIYELEEAGFFISTDDFFAAKNFQEILYKIEVIYNRRTHAVPDYSMEVPSSWKIKMIVNNDIEECSALLAECYINKNVFIKENPKIKKENMQRFVESNWSLFNEQKLSFKIIDKDENVLGVALNFELSNEKFLDMNELEELQSIFEFRSFLEDNYM